jgi:hypothetical protein|tara:strand:+ start:202 stop:2280 length:2079 start_codon:yes stop_codon:yes gene_type:complete
MAKGTVSLNSQGFHIVDYTASDNQTKLIDRYRIDPFGEIRRQTGQQQQTDLRTRSTKIHTFSGGHGRDIIQSNNANEGAEYQRFWDSTADTRWKTGARLGILQESLTNSIDAGNSATSGIKKIRDSFERWGNLYTIGDWISASGTKKRAVHLSSPSTTAWAFPTDSSGEGNGLYDAETDTTDRAGVQIIAYGDYIYNIYCGSSDVSGSTVNGTHIARGTPTESLTHVTSIANFGIGGTVSADAHIDIHGRHPVKAVIHNDVLVIAGTITGGIKFTTWNGSSATTRSDIVLPGKSEGINGFLSYGGYLWISTPTTLFRIDTSGSTWVSQPVISSSWSDINGHNMRLFEGAIWYPSGSTAGTPATIYKITPSGASISIDSTYGLNVGDGIPADAAGDIYDMFASNTQLYIAVGGDAADRKARIMAWNGTGWHTVYQHATANQKILWIHVTGDGASIGRALHFAVKGSTTADGQTLLDMYKLDGIETPPHTSSTIKRQSSSYIDLPRIDGGMPGAKAAWLRDSIHADDLSATTSNEYVALQSGKDGEVRTTNSIGNFLSGTTQLDHSSGAGDSSVSQALRLTLNRDASDNTDTPVVKSLESAYYKQVDTMEGFRFMVDLETTATEQGITTEAVITNLETIRDSVPLLPFVYGVRSTIYVRVVDMDFSELFDDTVDTSSSYSQRTGKVLVTIEQVL